MFIRTTRRVLSLSFRAIEETGIGSCKSSVPVLSRFDLESVSASRSSTAGEEDRPKSRCSRSVRGEGRMSVSISPRLSY